MKNSKITNGAKRAQRLSSSTRQMTIFEMLPDSEQIAAEPVAMLEVAAAPTLDAANPAASGVPVCTLSYSTNTPTSSKPQVHVASDIATLIRNTYNDIELRETVKVIYLSRANRVIGVHTIGIGSSTCCAFDLKSVCVGALLARAEGVILCHNHPSGTYTPSLQDDDITVKLLKALKILEITLLDHIIVTIDNYYSYQEKGKIKY
ncbi:MAG: JAB domain-containing protein [Muribaculaceae bacterium]|nr:JAB domain-containing protein [Muribaculaceae bacterium]